MAVGNKSNISRMAQRRTLADPHTVYWETLASYAALDIESCLRVSPPLKRFGRSTMSPFNAIKFPTVSDRFE
jgi:hypothetical protein